MSDDRHHFALTGWGLAWLMGIGAVTCAAACGSVEVGKLNVSLALRHRRLHYASGTLPTTLGTLQLQSGGFMLTGIPLVMGEHPATQVAKAEASLANAERALYRLRPAYVVMLRIVLAYVVSALDYVYDAMPPCPTRLPHTHPAVDRVLTTALRVPRNVPRALLWMPLTSGGFGFPHLYSRMQLRHVQGYLRAMDSRSVLIRENDRSLSHPNCWKGLDGPDQESLFHTMAEVSLEVCVLPAASAEPATVDTQVYRPYGSGGVLLVADGAMETTPDAGTLGWGGLVVDARGVLATAASGVLTRAASPWAAEWAGKVEAWRFAASLGVTPAGTTAPLRPSAATGTSPLSPPWWTGYGSDSRRPWGAAAPTCTSTRSTTPNGPASSRTYRRTPMTWRRGAWVWRAKAHTRCRTRCTGRPSCSHRAAW